jgi:hypothetical protein
MKQSSPVDNVRLLRNVLRDNDVSLGEVADLSEVDTGRVVRQLAGEEPLAPDVRKVALFLLRDRRIDHMIKVINILNVEGKTKMAEALTDVVQGWLDD